MRKRMIYSLYDRVSELYDQFPFPAQNDEDAKRGFTSLFKKNKDLRPEDYILYYIGVYDRVDGVIEGLNVPKLVISGLDLYRKAIKQEGEKNGGEE